MTSSEGLVLNDRYRLESQLGSGGMGSVWCARDVVLERRVALKELVHFERHHDAVQVTERRKRAVVEARALARVSHPAIVRIHDIFFTDSDPWIVMEYIKGRSLAAIIRDGSLGEREIARIGLPVLRGLSAAHAAEVVHRDVKPTNILVTDNSEVFLVDFGIAKISGDMSLTGHSKVLGTPEYLAPEQILGKPVGAPADLWALGVTFFCALEGYSPFRRDGDRPEAATMMAVLQADLPQPMRPGRLSKIVTRLLQKEPEQRADAAELSLALQAILDDGAPARPRPATPSAAAQPQTQTQPHMPAPSGWPAQPPPRRQPASPQSPYQQQRPPEQQPSRQQPPRQSPPPPPGWQPAPSPARPAARSSRDSATVAAQGPAVDAVRQAAPQEAAAMLLGMPEHRAAMALVGLPAREVGPRLEAVAATRPDAAGALLQMLTSAGAGHAVDYLSLEAAVTILGGLPEAEVARILSRTNVRTAAAVVMKLPVPASARVICAMPGKLAASVLEFVTPLTVATLLTTSDGPGPAKLNQSLLSQLSPPFRSQVSRYLPRPD